MPPGDAAGTIGGLQQFLAAVGPVARERGWRVLTLLRGACPFSTASEVTGGPERLATNQAALAHLRAMRPELVIADASRDVRVGLTELTPPGFVAAWRELETVGVPVLAVRDNPRFSEAPSACIDTFGRGAPECLVPRAELYAPPLPLSPELYLRNPRPQRQHLRSAVVPTRGRQHPGVPRQQPPHRQLRGGARAGGRPPGRRRDGPMTR